MREEVREDEPAGPFLWIDPIEPSPPNPTGTGTGPTPIALTIETSSMAFAGVEASIPRSDPSLGELEKLLGHLPFGRSVQGQPTRLKLGKTRAELGLRPNELLPFFTDAPSYTVTWRRNGVDEVLLVEGYNGDVGDGAAYWEAWKKLYKRATSLSRHKQLAAAQAAADSVKPAVLRALNPPPPPGASADLRPPPSIYEVKDAMAEESVLVLNPAMAGPSGASTPPETRTAVTQVS